MSIKIDFNVECDDIIKNMKLKSYEILKKDILKNSILRFINNGDTLEDKIHILNLVKNISWYWDVQISEYFTEVILQYFDADTLIVDYVTGKNKNQYSNSASKIYSYVATSGFVSDEDFIKIDDLNNLPSNIKKLILLDDFIGSGNTIIKQLKLIDSHNISDKEIIVLSYICHNIGKEKIEGYTSNNEITLVYEKTETSYLTKGMDQGLIDYINKICEKCKNEDIKYGYGNCGSMVSLNFLSPNNNLSMLYGKNIDDWDSLLDRNLNIIILHERKKEILLKSKYLVTQYYNNFFKDILEYDEFKLLILIYNCYGISEELLKEFHFCATIDDIQKLIESLRDKDILSDDYYLQIKNKSILTKLRNLDSYLNKEFKKHKNKKFY